MPSTNVENARAQKPNRNSQHELVKIISIFSSVMNKNEEKEK